MRSLWGYRKLKNDYNISKSTRYLSCTFNQHIDSIKEIYDERKLYR